MKSYQLPFLTALTLAVGLLLAAATTEAQTYPDRPIKLVVGYPAGGSSDTFARTIAQGLADRLKQPVVVDNRPGAGSTLATAFVAKAPADGYTLLMASDGNMTIAPALYSNPGYDSLRDFAPISYSIGSTMVLTANTAVGVKDLAGFVALAKSKPGVLFYGSSGTGSPPHLVFELIKAQTGVDIVHVAYKGPGPALLDEVANRVQFQLVTPQTAQTFLQDGKLVALGVTSGARSPNLPNVPTLAEAGLAGFAIESWNGVVAPARTPKPIVELLEREIKAVLEQADVKEKLTKAGFRVLAGNGETMATKIREDIPRFARAAKQAGVQPE